MLQFQANGLSQWRFDGSIQNSYRAATRRCRHRKTSMLTMRTFGCALLISISVIVLARPADAQPNNLIANGSFEQSAAGSGAAVFPGATDIASWVIAGNAITVLGSNYLVPADGSNSVALSDVFGPASIYQDIATSPGETYTLSFFFAPLPWDESHSQTNSMDVFWDGSLVGSYSAVHTGSTAPAVAQWTLQTITVIATGSTTRVTFKDTDSYNLAPLIDVVSVVANGSATNTGSSVAIEPAAIMPSGVATSVSITFDSVQTSGATTVSATSTGPPPPSGFKLTEPPTYYEIVTTATFSGPVRVCFTWTEGQIDNESGVTLFHHEQDNWVDITDVASRDTVQNSVCGTTLSFSPFTLFDIPYSFAGFFRPIDNLPVMNKAKAGVAIPVKFSLSGFYGLHIFMTGYPRSQVVQCGTGAPIADIEETASPGSAVLTYDSGTDQYVYIWKSDKAWVGTCRQLQVGLNDGEMYVANFTFTR